MAKYKKSIPHSSVYTLSRQGLNIYSKKGLPISKSRRDDMEKV